MSLIWNENNGGHDILIKGVLVHQIKEADIVKTLDTVDQKAASIVATVNAKDSLKEKQTEVALHITSLSPLRYTLRCGSDKEVLPDKWWEPVVEVAIGDLI